MDRSGHTVAKSLADSKGQSELETDAAAGEYELIVTNSGQLNDEQVELGRTDLNIKLAVSASPGSFDQARYRISARQLAISAKTKALIAAAQEKFERGSVRDAIDELEEAVKLCAFCSEAWSMRAFIKIAANDTVGAIEDASHAVELDANNAEAYLALGGAYNSKKDFRASEVYLRRALELHPDAWQAQLELAKAWYGQGRFVIAMRQLDLIQRDFPDLHLLRANVLVSLGRKHEGAAEFSTFLRKVPGDRRAPQIREIVAEIARAEQDSRPGSISH